MRRTLLLLTAVVLLAFTAVAAKQDEQAAAPQAMYHSFSHDSLHANPHALPRSLGQLKQKLQLLLAMEDIPGMQLALFDDNGVYWQLALGKRDIDKALPVTQKTLFRAGSTTKTFIALAIMQLADQGKLSLQDPVAELAPEVFIKNPWQATDPVKVLHLLEHSAGLDDMHFRNIYNVSDANISMLAAVNRDPGALTVRWRPGTRHAYSNPGYGVLGYLIEKFTQQSFEQYIKQHILQPSGLVNADMRLIAKVRENLSQGYNGSVALPYQDIYLRSAGSLHTSAYELALLGHLLLSGDRADVLANIDADDIRQMEQPSSTSAARAGLMHGYGLGIYATNLGKQRWLGHGGAIAGFLASYGYSPEIGKGYALLVNSDEAHIHGFLELITGYLALDHQVPHLLEPGLVSTEVDPAIKGYYRMVNERNELLSGITYPLNAAEIKAKGQKIAINPILGESQIMVHVGGQQFRQPENRHASAVFIKQTPEGKVFELDGQYYLESSPFAAWGALLAITFALLMVLLTLLYLPLWLTNAVLGKLSAKSRIRLRLFPAMASVCLCLVVIALVNLSPEQAGLLNWQTLVVYIFTLLFALFAGLSLWQLIKVWPLEPHIGVRYFSALSTGAVVFMAIYAWYFHYLGLSLWSW